MTVDHRLLRAAQICAAVLALWVCAPAQARYPAAFVTAAKCIHYWEAARSAHSYDEGWQIGWDNRANSESRGGMQFLYDTWQRLLVRHGLARYAVVIGRSVWVSRYPPDPAAASKAQQLYAAWLLYTDDQHSWHEWSTARGCGLS